MATKEESAKEKLHTKTPKKKPRYEDLTGRRFGRLVALEYLGKRFWRCKCDCGNEAKVLNFQLKNGTTKSCGCLKASKFKDETGKKYGKLTVLEYAGKINTRCMWKCRCDCGNIVLAQGAQLRNGKHRSCGCLDISHKGSAPEHEILKYIPKTEVVRHDRKILDGKEIDLYFPEYKIGIEYNGTPFHASKGNPFKNKDKSYHYLKWSLARQKGIRLISIFDVDWLNNKEAVIRRIQAAFANRKKHIALDQDQAPQKIVLDNDIDDVIGYEKMGYKIVEHIPSSYCCDKSIKEVSQTRGYYKVYRCGYSVMEKLA